MPGILLRAAAVTGPGGRPGIALLVSANVKRKGPRTLLFLDPERRAVERLADGLEEDVNALSAFDLAGTGQPSPVAGMQGVLLTPGGAGVRRVFEQPQVDLLSVAGSAAERPWIPAAHTGQLELLAAAPGGTLARVSSFPLPVQAERQRWGLRLTSPPVTLLAGDPPLFAAGPDEVGRRRLKTLLIPAAGGEPTEAWSLLPGDERLMNDRRYLRLDGVPVLVATTFDRIGIFTKKRLRLFVLGRDRSRKGSGPTLAFETDCPLWYPLDAAADDADGDGRQDLIVVHPVGLRNKELLVSAFHGLGGGRLDPKPRRWTLNDQADDWLYGADLTGDGVADFAVLVKDRLLLYAGDPKGSRPLAARPVWAVPVIRPPKSDRRRDDESAEPPEQQPGGAQRERLLLAFDLPGGGRVLLAQGAQPDGRSVLTVVRR